MKQKLILLSLLPLCLVAIIYAQDTTVSLAFKNNRSGSWQYILYRPNLSYQLWQHFNLIRDANSGDALAEHELGIRYLTGEGFPHDTTLGAYWIGKAAKQKLTGACYNYGILLNNGWGVAWNPFKAFNFFLEAANDDMPQAQYIVGLSYTDNLVVKRDWSKSYFWLKKAANNGFPPAKEALTELLKRISISSIDTSNTADQKEKDKFSKENSNDKVLASSTGLVFIDFNSIKDTMQVVSNRIILDDILHEGNDSLAKALNISFKNDSTFPEGMSEGTPSEDTHKFDSTNLKTLKDFAENGSPEALTLLGKLYDEGIYFNKDLIKAAEYYIRAAKLDSPRAPVLLWNEINSKYFLKILKDRVDKNDPRAMYVWYGLFTLEFNNQITSQEAANFLIKSSASNFLPSINELGLNYYTGKIFPVNKTKALAIWKEAAKLGSREAKLRIAVANLYEDNFGDKDSLYIKTLNNFINNGSVLAQASLGYCYENGIAVTKDFGLAAKYFRFAAQRGSMYAYNELKKMYDEIRPKESEFNIN
ncbi:MAG: tetratricopeptide repeat protein [Ignavibacteriaceae bacterium]